MDDQAHRACHLHKARHQYLHDALEEMLDDYILHVGSPFNKTTILGLLNWSQLQTISPSVKLSDEEANDGQ